MAKNLDTAINAVEMTYDEVIGLANDIVTEVTADVDEVINFATNNIENLNNDMIRDILLKLALKSYSFAPIKDKAAFKAQLAETLRKEAYSKAFSTLEGTVAVKENNANLMISEQIIVEQIYELAADLLKTKVDETHRVIATITSVLTTRLSEAKLTQVEVQ